MIADTPNLGTARPSHSAQPLGRCEENETAPSRKAGTKAQRLAGKNRFVCFATWRLSSLREIFLAFQRFLLTFLGRGAVTHTSCYLKYGEFIGTIAPARGLAVWVKRNWKGPSQVLPARVLLIQKRRKLTSTSMRTFTGVPLRTAGLNRHVRMVSMAFSSKPRPRGFTTFASCTFPATSTMI